MHFEAPPAELVESAAARPPLRHPRPLHVIPGSTGDPGLHGFPLKPALDLIGGGNDDRECGNDEMLVIPGRCSVIPGSTGDPGLPGFPLSRE